MSTDSSFDGFSVVRRGCDRGQVDDLLSGLVADRDNALARISAQEKQIEELRLAVRSARAANPKC